MCGMKSRVNTRKLAYTYVHSSVRMYQVLFSQDTQNIQLLFYNMYYKYMFSLLYSYTKQHLFTALFAHVRRAQSQILVNALNPTEKWPHGTKKSFSLIEITVMFLIPLSMFAFRSSNANGDKYKAFAWRNPKKHDWLIL